MHYLTEAEGVDRINSYTDLVRALQKLGVQKEVAQFNRYKFGSKTIPFSILKGVKEIFPRVPWEALTTESIDSFFEIVAAEQRKYEPWINATAAVARHRLSLSLAAKNYYAGIDAAPSNFPLVAGDGWLLDKPLLLEEIDDMTNWNGTVRGVESSPLWEGGVEYIDIKRKKIKGEITNGRTYRMLSLAMKDGKPLFTFGRGRYFDYINTLEILAAEFAMNPTDLSPTRHPMRGAPSNIFELLGRSAFPGINVLLIVKNFQGHTSKVPLHRFALHKRGQQTAEAQNTIHVVPAGSHQPLGPEHETEADMAIWRTAVREFIEELFNKEEAHAMKYSSAGFFEEPQIRGLVNTFFRKEGSSRLYYLGTGFDPLTTKPEILCALVVDWKIVSAHDETMSAKYFRNILDYNYEGEVYFVPLSIDNLKDEATRHRRQGSILPAGAACLLQASRPEFYDVLVNMR
jgi:hypothetical protein